MPRGSHEWKSFRKAAAAAQSVLFEGLSDVGAPRDETESVRRVQTLRVLFIVAASTRGFLDIPDWKKSNRPYLQNIIRWVRDNPPYMRRVFEFSDLFEPSRQPLLWRIRPSEGAIREAVEILLETDPPSWDPCWPGDVYPLLADPATRRETGAYYTPPAVVSFVLQQSLGPLCYRGHGDKSKPREESEILSIKALDPSMGGGRFIVAAVDYIAEALAASRGENKTVAHLRAVAPLIYGVDKDPVAVDAARISLWLSIGGPERPWDYLRHHLTAGDSIIGATIDDMELETVDVEDANQLGLFKTEAPKRPPPPPLRPVAESMRMPARLEALADIWTAAVMESDLAREEFPIARISMPQVSEERWADIENKPGFNEARRLAKKLGFLHWELRFPEALLQPDPENRGFDAVFGNPPYRKERGSGASLPFRQLPLARKWGEGKMDLLSLFMHRGLDLLKPGGRLSFITSSYWIKAEGAVKLRKRITSREAFSLFMDLGSLPIFDGVTGRHCITTLQRDVRHPNSLKVLRLKHEKSEEPSSLGEIFVRVKDFFASEDFSDQRHIVDEIGDFNIADRAADVVCRKMDEAGIPLGDLCRSSQGVVENPPELTLRMINELAKKNPSLVEEENYEPGEPVFLLPRNHHILGALSELEKELLKPFYRPSSIREYSLPSEPDGFLLYLTPRNCPDITEFPWLREHLQRYRVFTEERREVKEGRIAWWHIHWPRDEDLFEKEHILMPQMAEKPRAARAKKSAFAGMSAHVIADANGLGLGFVAAVLNSRAVHYYLSEGGRAKERGIGLDITLAALRKIPLPRVPGSEKSDPKKTRELMAIYKDWMGSFKESKR